MLVYHSNLQDGTQFGSMKRGFVLHLCMLHESREAKITQFCESKVLHQTPRTDLSAVGLEAVKDGCTVQVCCYTSSELLAAVQGRDLAGTDREGARQQLSPPHLLPQLAMASFICHHPSPTPPTPLHSRHLCLTRLRRRRRAETTPVTFVFVPSIRVLPNALIGHSECCLLPQQLQILAVTGVLSLNDLPIGST